MTREAWDRRHSHLTQWYHHARGLPWELALVAAQRQTEYERGPRPPVADTGKRPSLLSLGWGMLTHREETMGRILDGIKRGLTSITFRKAAMGFVATLFGAVAMAVQSDASFSTALIGAIQQQGVIDAAVQMFADGGFPFPAEIVAALFGALANIGRNKVKQARRKSQA